MGVSAVNKMLYLSDNDISQSPGPPPSLRGGGHGRSPIGERPGPVPAPQDTPLNVPLPHWGRGIPHPPYRGGITQPPKKTKGTPRPCSGRQGSMWGGAHSTATGPRPLVGGSHDGGYAALRSPRVLLFVKLLSLIHELIQAQLTNNFANTRANTSP